jgi:hypothetical protein
LKKPTFFHSAQKNTIFLDFGKKSKKLKFENNDDNTSELEDKTIA